MHVKKKEQCQPFVAEHGEIAYELIGDAAGGGNQHSVAHIELLPNKASLKHFHPEVEESYYILTGTARMVIDGETKILHPGEAVVIPPKAVHQIFNDNDTALHFLAVCAPGWTPDCSVFL